MARYIDSDVLMKELEKMAADDSFHKDTKSRCQHRSEIKSCMYKVSMQPTADVAPIVHGEWLRHEPNPRIMEEFHEMGIGKGMSINSIYWTCSECGCWGTPSHNYCFKCGAKMDGKDRAK